MWGPVKDGVLKACDEVGWKKRVRRSKGDTWWRNEDVKEAVSKMKVAHKAVCQNSTEENKRRIIIIIIRGEGGCFKEERCTQGHVSKQY